MSLRVRELNIRIPGVREFGEIIEKKRTALTEENIL